MSNLTSPLVAERTINLLRHVEYARRLTSALNLSAEHLTQNVPKNPMPGFLGVMGFTNMPRKTAAPRRVPLRIKQFDYGNIEL